MKFIAFGQSLDRRDRPACDGANRGNTGAGGLACDKNVACAALPFAASVFAACEVQIIAQREQQALGWIDRHLPPHAVYLQIDEFFHAPYSVGSRIRLITRSASPTPLIGP